VSLAVTLLSSVALFGALMSQLMYTLKSGQPAELGALAKVDPSQLRANEWVHGSGQLEAQALGYRRPLDSDRFRLARVENNSRLWVELREPSGSLAEHFVPPSSFVGRLVPLSSPGVRHAGVLDALAASGQRGPSAGDWMLIDGESPRALRWVIGVLGLLLFFSGFSAFGIYRLLMPIRTR
jgi:hypothetical protein